MNFTLRIPLAIAAMAFVLGGCHANSSYNPSQVAATVNGVPIGKERIDFIMKQRMMQGRPDSPQIRKDIIQNLAVQIIASEEGLKKGLDKRPETQEQLEMARRSILANAFVEDYIKEHPVTDEAVQKAYDQFKADSSGNEYKARHILVDKESEAKDIIAKLKKDPKAFAAIAKDKSKDPGSKASGGDLGWFDPRSMVPEFGQALKKLEKGQMTQEPVKSQYGYHIILLEDERPKPVPSLDEVKPMLKQDVQQKELRAMLDNLKAKAKIDIKEEPAAAPAPAPAPAPAASAPAPAAASAPAAPAEAPKK